MDSVTLKSYVREAVDILSHLIKTPSFSKEEDQTAKILCDYLETKSIPYKRVANNIICTQQRNSDKPILVLNSHHDTVKPSDDWTKDPFSPEIETGKLYGLGSNDAGGCLVSLLQTFIHYYDSELPYQLVLIASAEEEISGKNGLKKALTSLDVKPSLAIVGEPTQTNMAIAEKGLLVIDAYAFGKAGHAANEYGDNAIINAVKDIESIQNLDFDKQSEQLGSVKLTVTQINAGKQHNVVPDRCHFVIDCRVTDCYTNSEVLQVLKDACLATLEPRSTHLNSSSIPKTHPLVKIGIALGKEIYGSHTLSDQVFFDCPSVKIGPGDTNRSHRADEYIYLEEIQDGISTYISLIEKLKNYES